MTYSLTLRQEKGSVLTIEEMDNNFQYLDNKGGSSILLRTNNVTNASQTILNLKSGLGITLDNTGPLGTVEISTNNSGSTNLLGNIISYDLTKGSDIQMSVSGPALGGEYFITSIVFTNISDKNSSSNGINIYDAPNKTGQQLFTQQSFTPAGGKSFSIFLQNGNSAISTVTSTASIFYFSIDMPDMSHPSTVDVYVYGQILNP